MGGGAGAQFLFSWNLQFGEEAESNNHTNKDINNDKGYAQSYIMPRGDLMWFGKHGLRGSLNFSLQRFWRFEEWRWTIHALE